MVQIKKKKMKELLEAHNRGEDVCPRAATIHIEEFPDDLTRLPSRDIGRLYSRYTAALGPLSDELCQARVEQKFLTGMLRRAKARAAFTARGIKLQKWASVYRDSEVVDFMRQEMNVQARILGLTSVLWTIKDYLRALEFERDRRIQEVKTEGYSGQD